MPMVAKLGVHDYLRKMSLRVSFGIDKDSDCEKKCSEFSSFSENDLARRQPFTGIVSIFSGLPASAAGGMQIASLSTSVQVRANASSSLPAVIP